MNGITQKLTWFGLKGIFLENNYKIQTISLVRQCFKLISYLTIRVQWTRFTQKVDMNKVRNRVP